MEKFLPLNQTPSEITAFTPDWKGERFSDGRPKVSDDIINRMKSITLTQAWSVLHKNEHLWQFEGGWMPTQPGKVLAGRAVTAVYMPRRESLKKLLFEKAHAAGCVGDHVSWTIDTLIPGDVYVADVLGEIDYGAVVGDNLSTSILAKTGNGVVHDGSVRDLEGVAELEDFVSFFRCFNPESCTRETLLMGINAPVRIGHATVMPGDVVLGKDHGVLFIPPHLAEKVVATSEIILLRDIFGKMRLSEKKYTPGEIDTGTWEPRIVSDFRGWLTENINDLPVPSDVISAYLDQKE